LAGTQGKARRWQRHLDARHAGDQACYTQQSSQAEGVGFPLVRIVAVICLSTGAVWDAAMGAFEGKGNSELGLLRGLSAALSAGACDKAAAITSPYFSNRASRLWLTTSLAAAEDPETVA
jgi:hypothetical protein